MGNTFWTSHEIGNMILAVGVIVVLFLLLFLAFLMGINFLTVIYFLFSAAAFVLICVWIFVGLRVLKFIESREKTPLP